ncbi:MAG: TetR/AcrR family transcriptional regulator [Candidatus Ornithospirochaeta sp.]
MNQRENILAKALEICGGQGIDSLTTKNIASETGIGKATLYHYFQSKEEIVSEMMKYGHARLMKNGFQLDLGGSVEEIIRKASQKWEDLFLEEGNWYFLRTVFSLHFTNEDAESEYRSLYLMLSSQATVIVSAFPIPEEKKRTLSSLLSSSLMVSLERILEDEDVDFSSVPLSLVKLLDLE